MLENEARPFLHFSHLGGLRMSPNLKASIAPLILRLGLASIFLYHGYLKIWPHDALWGMSWQATLPAWQQLVVAWGEVIGGLMLAAGLLSRLAAMGFIFLQLGAIILFTGGHDFVRLPRSLGRASDEAAYRMQVGYEYNFALIVMCLCLLILGSGRWSIDNGLRQLRRGRKSETAPLATEPPVVVGAGAGAGPGNGDHL
jgi:putative oxidoreductase